MIKINSVKKDIWSLVDNSVWSSLCSHWGGYELVVMCQGMIDASFFYYRSVGFTIYIRWGEE